MEIAEILIVAGTAFSVLATATGIILDAINKRQEIRRQKADVSYQEKQITIEEGRFNVVDLTRTAMENITSYAEVDSRIRESIRQEIERLIVSLSSLQLEYTAYKELCRNNSSIMCELLDVLELEFETLLLTDQDKMRDLRNRINLVRRNIN